MTTKLESEKYKIQIKNKLKLGKLRLNSNSQIKNKDFKLNQDLNASNLRIK